MNQSIFRPTDDFTYFIFLTRGPVQGFVHWWDFLAWPMGIGPNPAL